MECKARCRRHLLVYDCIHEQLGSDVLVAASVAVRHKLKARGNVCSLGISQFQISFMVDLV